MHLSTKYYEIFQYKFLSPSELNSYSKDRGLIGFGHDGVFDLWRLGLVRADGVISTSPITRAGLTLTEKTEGQYLYSDSRKLKNKKKGWGDAFKSIWKPKQEIKLLFHPFRFYILYHLERVFSQNILSGQYLWNKNGYITLSELRIKNLDSHTSSSGFIKSVTNWNEVCELAISLEPWTYPEIFSQIKWNGFGSFESHQEKVSEMKKEVRTSLLRKGIEKLEDERKWLCKDANTIDQNGRIHLLLRLAKGDTRHGLKGAIGGAMILLTMAEMYRRASEDVFDVKLPEEDELRPGQWVPGTRKMLYGTERILDAERQVINEYLFQLGLNYNIRINCYVEGDTELGALKQIAGIETGVAFINIKGQFLIRNKGVSFRDALRNDMASKIYSVIVLDGDNVDNVRAVKKAAKDGEMKGLFYISKPDFEMHNFTVKELAEVALEIAKDNGIQKIDFLRLIEATANSSSGNEFIKKAHEFSQELERYLGKGEMWGERLYKYASKKPYFRPKGSSEEKEREIMRIAMVLRNATMGSYEYSTLGKRCDPESGKMVDK